MKLTKYTFRTPLCGSIDCSDVLPNKEHIELSPRQMCKLYTKYEELASFLKDKCEDMTQFAYEELQVLRAEFGDYAMRNGEMYFMTYIWTRNELSSELLARLEDWIIGQMYDGWGEHLETDSWMQERVPVSNAYFDEESLTFETDCDEWFVYYYVHSWGDEYGHEIFLQECEEVEFAEAEEIAHISVPNYERHVYKVKDEFSLKELLSNVKQSELTTMIETVCYEPGCTYYLVFEGADKDKLLPKWACDYGQGICSVYYKHPVSGLCCTSSGISVEEAIMHILA